MNSFGKKWVFLEISTLSDLFFLIEEPWAEKYTKISWEPGFKISPYPKPGSQLIFCPGPMSRDRELGPMALCYPS